MKKVIILLCTIIICLSGCIGGLTSSVNKPPFVTIGETASSNSLRITLKKVYCNKEIPSTNQSLYTAEKGKVYVVLIFEAENISESSQSINLFGSKAYADDYVVKRLLLLDVFGESSFDGSIDAGKKQKGYVAYEADENWNKFEFTLQDVPTGEVTEFRFSFSRNQTSAQ